MKVSYNQLQELTGKSYRTIKKKLENLRPIGAGQNNADLWDSKEALEAIYISVSGNKLDPQQEKAKLDEARRIEIERKHKESLGELVKADDVLQIWSSHIINARTKLVAIGAKLAPMVAELNNKNKIKAEIDKLIFEVLDDLANESNNGD